MAIDIQKALEKKLAEGGNREMGLTDRLDYLDNYNKDVAVPQISSQGPKGYNPINSLEALFQMITNRKSVSQDLTNQGNTNLDVLSSLADYEKQNASTKMDPLKLLELQLKAKEQGMKLNLETMSFEPENVISKEKQEAIDLVDEIMGRDVGALVGVPNPFKIPSNITTKAKVEQLKSKLSLAERQKLKGSGQISDKEQEMLANSVSSLRYTMSNADFTAELGRIKDILSGKYRNVNEPEGDKQAGEFTIKEVK